MFQASLSSGVPCQPRFFKYVTPTYLNLLFYFNLLFINQSKPKAEIDAKPKAERRSRSV